jgi:hypothetical protein
VGTNTEVLICGQTRQEKEQQMIKRAWKRKKIPSAVSRVERLLIQLSMGLTKLS